MPPTLTRRTFCRAIPAVASCAAIPWAAPWARAAATPDDRQGLTLSIGNYGMQSRSVEDAVRAIAEAGFDGVELSLMPDWDSAPAKLSADRRRQLRQMLADSGLRLNALMEDLPPSADQANHQAALDRLKLAAELGSDLSPNRQPLIQTVLGGGEWEDKKSLFRDRLEDWLRVAETHETVIAIKPHRGGAMSQPSEAAWLLGQLEPQRPRWLGMVYDYSHYAFRDLSISDTVKAAAPYTVHVAVKDAVQRGDRVEFALPGEANTIDYAAILSAFYEHGYRGDVCCEVSSQIFRREGYDAVAAARASYAALDRAFATAGIPRRSKGDDS